MYHLRINGMSLFFQYWMDVVGFFHNKGLVPETEYLVTTDWPNQKDHNFLLFQIVGIGELRVTNNCLVERGDDYVSIELEKITFQDVN